jgi:TPR repeat protein
MPEKGETKLTPQQSDIDARCQLDLQRFNSGEATAEDLAQVVVYYRAAAGQGYRTAQYLLAKMYDEGWGVARDMAEAAAWYRRAAEQGYLEAQYNLGCMYESGEGVPQDQAQAVVWFRRAAEQDYAYAQLNLGYAYDCGEGVAEDKAQAAAWYRRAAAHGVAAAQHNLGLMYEHGESVLQDQAQALAWFRRAAEQGYADAQFKLAHAYYQGLGVVQDLAQAAGWYRKVAEQGDAGAQYNLACLYHYGAGVAQDYAQAAEWYRRAAEQGNVDARRSLIEMNLDHSDADETAAAPTNPQKVTDLINALTQCLPQFDPAPMLANPPEDEDALLDWMTGHLGQQGLHDYWEWKEYWGELPELRPLAGLDLAAFNERFVWDTMESLDGFAAIVWPGEAPFIEYINSFLVVHGLRLIDLLPFENAHILCVKDDAAALEQLERALAEFNMTFDRRDALDEEGVRTYIKNLS